MPDRHLHSLESLKKEAKRWLAALRAGSAEARQRFAGALHPAPANPSLRDVQHALAREHGFAGWAALKEAGAQSAGAGDNETLARYEAMVTALLDAYRTGTPEAMERVYQFTGHRRAWQTMRSYIQLDLGIRDPDADITIEQARRGIALAHGFSDWQALETFAKTAPRDARRAAKPVGVVRHGAIESGSPSASSRDWGEIFALLAAHPGAGLRAHGQMTDDVLADIAGIESVTALHLDGSRAVTDEGVRHLARMPQLTHLDLSGTAITDRALDVLANLPALESISLAMAGVSDAGASRLAHCDMLERVDLSGTHTGDGALRALAGKSKLRQLQTGKMVTDAGLPLLHEIPVFKKWHGGEPQFALLSYEAEPNGLVLRGTFTDRGMAALRGLDGLFGLNLDARELAITADAMIPLTSLPNLGWLAVDAKDDWMPHIAAMPRLRFLGAQDTVAGDDGFEALSRSSSIEYIWGRRCHRLGRRGFAALAAMPALRGLSVSCLNVDDAGIATLPEFPALRELMPMDIPDAGYRHIGRCAQLESLILMYCRDTTDAATEQITSLDRLSYYFNSYTVITDRTPALLSTMPSLTRITFDACHSLTDAGVGLLARLPRLRQLRVSGNGITPRAADLFGPEVTVAIGG